MSMKLGSMSNATHVDHASREHTPSKADQHSCLSLGRPPTRPQQAAWSKEDGSPSVRVLFDGYRFKMGRVDAGSVLAHCVV